MVWCYEIVTVRKEGYFGPVFLTWVDEIWVGVKAMANLIFIMVLFQIL